MIGTTLPPSVFELALAQMDVLDTPLEIASRCFPEYLDRIFAAALRRHGAFRENRLGRQVEIIAGIYSDVAADLSRTLARAGRPENSFAVTALRHAAYKFFRLKGRSHLEALDAAVALLGGRPHGTRSSVQKAVHRWRAEAPMHFQLPYAIKPVFAHLPDSFARELSYTADMIELLLICRENHERMKRERMPDRHGGRRNPPPV